VNTVHVSYAWLVPNVVDKFVFKREDERAMWLNIAPDLKEYRTAFKIEVFNPKQSGLCNGWCPVTSCEFWKPKRKK
jgi:hypothetical protein